MDSARMTLRTHHKGLGRDEPRDGREGVDAAGDADDDWPERKVAVVRKIEPGEGAEAAQRRGEDRQGGHAPGPRQGGERGDDEIAERHQGPDRHHAERDGQADDQIEQEVPAQDVAAQGHGHVAVVGDESELPLNRARRRPAPRRC